MESPVSEGPQGVQYIKYYSMLALLDLQSDASAEGTLRHGGRVSRS